MSNQSSDYRQIEVSVRLNKINQLGAWAIAMLMLVATWGHWRSFTAVVVAQLTLLPFNAWVTLWLLKRRGVKTAELIRAVVNLAGTVLLGALTHWPLPMWLWLPFAALAFDHLGLRVARAIVIALCAAEVIGGLAAGVHWLYPLTFVTLAIFCSELSRVRFQEMGRMLAHSDAQRSEIEAAHRELRQAHENLRQETQAREHAEIDLRHAQKLEAVGRLASGIAHEINTPVQFVSDSVHFLQDGTADLLRMCEAYRGALTELEQGASRPELAKNLAEVEQQLDLAFLQEELPEAASRSLEGLRRIAEIVRSMKEFAHPDSKEARPIDLNSAIMSTLTIARGEYKHVAQLDVELGTLPLVTCHAGEINQVILNLLVNAAHAIADKLGNSGELGTIVLRTRSKHDRVVISIADSGCGIPEQLRERIFEPFFTTKEVGRGTGQGLALARAIVLRHGGELTFRSEVGVGTTFEISLPLAAPDTAVAA
jgi:signal transduction histidine kinase